MHYIIHVSISISDKNYHNNVNLKKNIDNIYIYIYIMKQTGVLNAPNKVRIEEDENGEERKTII